MTVTPEISRAFAETEDLTPASVELFLRTTGWRRTQFRDGVSAIWENSAADASLMLPYNQAYRDYRPRLKEALATIATVHGIGLDALPIEIASASSDILFLRADQSAAGGSIPLREAQALLDGVSRMMLAAACSAIRPKASNPGRRPAAAHEFVRHGLRMGHTLRDGFVMTILARHDDAYLPLEPERVALGEAEGLRLEAPAPARIRLDRDDSEPFSRRVMATLATGLEAVRELLDPKEDISLDTAVDRGASLELVESVGRMAAQDAVSALDLAFLWSPSQQVQPDVPQRIVVPRPDPERVDHVSESLKLL